MAVPKKRTTKASRGQRRSHLALVATSMTSCSHCHKPSRPHAVCAACGYYRGRQVIKV